MQDKSWKLRREQNNEDAFGRKKLWEAEDDCGGSTALGPGVCAVYYGAVKSPESPSFLHDQTDLVPIKRKSSVIFP